MKTWLILDVSFLARRAFYTTKSLEFGGVATGVIYGVFKDVANLQNELGSKDTIWCFDREGSKRREMFPDYKKKRHSRPLTPKELKEEKEFQFQLKRMRRKLLPMMGAKNVFHKKGYESDDFIASVCKNLPKGDRAIIVTADADLYQCLSDRVSLFNLNKGGEIITPDTLFRDYGVTPEQWARVKTIGGCRTDEVPGVPGVAEGTAIKFVTKTLPIESKKYRDIISEEGIKVRKRNKKLVVLPLKGTPDVVPVSCELSLAGWNKVLSVLGFKSMNDKVPLGGGARPNRKKLNKGFGI